MNLFCFTLGGSTESIYKPAPSPPTEKEVLPPYQCSPALRSCRSEWGGSEPSLNTDRPPSTTKSKKNHRRSCVPTSASENQTLDKDINCWSDKKDFSHQMKEMCKAPCQSSDRVKRPNSDRTRTSLPTQDSETAADTAETIHSTGRKKKLQKQVHQSGDEKWRSTSESDDVSSNNPVLTCMGLGRRTEKKPSKTATSPHREQQQQQQARAPQENSDEEGVWGPRLRNDLWSPCDFYHSCQQPRHELRLCGGALSLPWATEWDRFESLIQELDSKQSDLSPQQTICPDPDLPLTQNTLCSFGRFDASKQHSPLMKPQDNDSPLLKQEHTDDPTKCTVQRRESDRTHVKPSPETKLTGITSGSTQKDEAEKREVGGCGGTLTNDHRRSSHSQESLYSINSGQSSSSGVISGSGYSSNRDSLRLEEDALYTRQLCGRARVHTEFVPSPYDTESLRLKVGDVIDIIARPPMGIWTGVLNGRTGNFKFIYVDVLREKRADTHERTQAHRMRQKSTVQELLKRLSLEEYSPSLQLNGYQTVEDLTRLTEHHLMKLNVTDPEHRHRLLAAVHSLQLLHSDRQLENEDNQETQTPKADMKNRPRDSGCHMPSDNSTEDTYLHFITDSPLPAEATAS